MQGWMERDGIRWGGVGWGGVGSFEMVMVRWCGLPRRAI